jgi:hypothetical protein
MVADDHSWKYEHSIGTKGAASEFKEMPLHASVIIEDAYKNAIDKKGVYQLESGDIYFFDAAAMTQVNTWTGVQRRILRETRSIMSEQELIDAHELAQDKLKRSETMRLGAENQLRELRKNQREEMDAISRLSETIMKIECVSANQQSQITLLLQDLALTSAELAKEKAKNIDAEAENSNQKTKNAVLKSEIEELAENHAMEISFQYLGNVIRPPNGETIYRSLADLPTGCPQYHFLNLLVRKNFISSVTQHAHVIGGNTYGDFPKYNILKLEAVTNSVQADRFSRLFHSKKPFDKKFTIEKLHQHLLESMKVRRFQIDKDTTYIVDGGFIFIFHGGSLSDLLAICDEGFRMQMARAGNLGTGSYGALNSSKSDAYSRGGKKTAEVAEPLYMLFMIAYTGNAYEIRGDTPQPKGGWRSLKLPPTPTQEQRDAGLKK